MAEAKMNGPLDDHGQRSWKWVKWISSVLLVVGISLSVLLYFIARDSERQGQLAQFDQRVDHMVFALQSALNTQYALLQSLSSFVQVSADLDQTEFAAYTSALLETCEGVQALEWIPYITREQRAEFEIAARSPQFPEFVIKEMSPEGELVRSGEKEEYFPVCLVYPVEGNARAVGFDLGSEPSRRQALLRAVETNKPVATAPITLVQEDGNQTAFLIFLPVWSEDSGKRISRSLRGFVLGGFRSGDMIDGALANVPDRVLPMDITDLDAGGSGLILRNHAETDERQHLKRQFNLNVGTRRWQVTLLSHAHQSRWSLVMPLLILVSGILLTVVSCLLLNALARGRASAEKLIQSRTRALSASEERLRTVADLSTDFVFWLQRDKTLKYVSPAAFTVTGYEVEEFIEQPNLLDAIIHPLDREKWAEHWSHTLSGESCRAMELRINSRKGETRWVRHQCRPILSEDGAMIGVRGNFSDITEARQNAERLAQERRLFTGGPVVVFRWRAEEGWPVEYVSPNVDAIFGVEAEDLITGKFRYADFVHPEDLQRVGEEVTRHVDAGEYHFEQDYRIVDRFGKVFDIFDVTLVVRDAEGNPTHYEGYVLDVTEREEARRELNENRQRLDLALSGAGLGLWDWNVKSGSVVFDERWAGMLGYDLDELDQNLETWSNLVHPEDMPHVTKTLQDHMDGKSSQYETEHRLKHKDGHWVWVLDRGKVLHHDEDGQPLRAVGTHQDITDRRRHEDRQAKMLYLRERTAQDLAQCTSPAGIMKVAARLGEEFSTKVGGTFSFLMRLTEGEGAARLVQHWQDSPDGHPTEIFNQVSQEAGDHWWRLTSNGSGVALIDRDQENLPDFLRGYLTHQGAHTLVLMSIPVGTRRRYVLGIGVSGGGGARLSLDTESFLTIRDSFAYAQQRVAFRQENESTRRLLVKALERAEQANKVQTSFLARMSHEIRTPLTAIAGLTDILGRHSRHLDTKEKAWLDQVRHNTDHLVALLNDLLDLSKIDAGELQINRGPLEITDVLTTVENTLESRAQEKGIQLRIGCSPRVPARFDSDRLRLRQILLNLASNAVKFTDQGQVEVDADFRGISGDEVGELVVTVRDTGTGIPADQLEAIFQPFQQASGVDLSTRGGTGLGLDISRRLARALGGDITVVSQVGLGSVFTLTLPITGSQCAMSGASRLTLPDFEQPDSPDSYPDLAGRRILVVDDNPDNRQVITYYLEEVGIVPYLAEDGAQGVEKARAAAAGDTPFDLILMDMRMPVLNGYEATAKLRQLGLRLPIIALTAHAMDGDELACINFGCNAYLSKPIDPNTLLATIARLLAAAEGSKDKQAPKKSKLIPDRRPTDPRFAPLVIKYQQSLVKVRQDLVEARGQMDRDAVYNIAHKLHGTGANFGFPEISVAARDCEERLHQGDELAEVDELDVLDELMLAAVAELKPEPEPVETK